MLKYAQDVIKGKIDACQFVKQAAQRFVNDLKLFPFSEKEAQGAVNFMQKFRHTKGGLAGELIHLEDWEKFIVYNIFGFTENGKRRFKKAYIEVPRKNGKTMLGALVANYCFLADGEEGNEIYTAATKLDQAAICFDQAYNMFKGFNTEYDFEMVMNNSWNNRRIVYESNLFKPLSKEHKTLDGLNPHCAIIDEYHAHPSDELYNVLVNGMGARVQPLLFTITTAGFDRNSACYNHREYCTRVLNGSVQDDSLFAVIYTMDEADDWTQESTWRKANPNYGVSVQPSFLAEQVKEAKESPTKEVEFKTKLLNVWTDAAVTWIPDSLWMKGAKDVNTGRECYGGLDLAAVSDFCALTLAFPHEGGYKIITKYYLPDSAIRERKDDLGKQIRRWAQDGWITVTDGNTTDYSYIRADIKKLAAEYDLRSIAYDRYNSSQLVIDLQEDGILMEGFGQGVISMSAPTKEVERLVKQEMIWHGDNPVTRWQMGNVVLKHMEGDNVKISKEKSTNKVDGPVSIVMAIGQALDAQREPEPDWALSEKL